nr:Chain A, Tachyplesin 1 [synthetic construct]1MA6_A Chain A, Tachyplesin I [synthetic construct]
KWYFRVYYRGIYYRRYR